MRQDMWTSRQEQNNTAKGLKTTLWKQERAADFSSDDVSGDEDTVIDDSLKADLEGVVSVTVELWTMSLILT